ncbi:hypothetical protein ACFX13_006603 [Malus domestica]
MAITQEEDEGEAQPMQRRWRVGVIEKRESRRTVKIPFSFERANNEMKKRNVLTSGLSTLAAIQEFCAI